MNHTSTRVGRRSAAVLAAVAIAAIVPTVTATPASAIAYGYAAGGGYPYVAEVTYTPTGGLCTGTLIHPRWVLTAVHCVESRDAQGRIIAVPPNTVTARIGNTRRSTGGTLSTIERIEIHPSYGGGYNDIALLRLSSAQMNLPRVGLAPPGEVSRWDGAPNQPGGAADSGVAVGWGVDSTGAFPAELRYRPVTINPPLAVVPRALQVSGGPCGGDSGGPLLVRTTAGATVQAGVLKAADCSTIGRYSEVGAGTNRDWIRGRIPDLDNPLPYGPNSCINGYVWREAYASDVVCVTPATRSQAAYDNSQRDNRRNPSGAYGPNTCWSPYVWRAARPDDLVCVTTQTRADTAADNQAAASRRL